MESRPKRARKENTYMSVDDFLVDCDDSDTLQPEKRKKSYHKRIPKDLLLREPKMNWTPEEDALLTSGVEKFGSSGAAWSNIAKLFDGTRDAKRCRERWIEYIDPKISHDPFTSDEDQVLLSMQNHLGNQWKEIAIKMGCEFPQRSSTGIKSRWHQLKKRNVELVVDEEVDTTVNKLLRISTRLKSSTSASSISKVVHKPKVNREKKAPYVLKSATKPRSANDVTQPAYVDSHDPYQAQRYQTQYSDYSYPNPMCFPTYTPMPHKPSYDYSPYIHAMRYPPSSLPRAPRYERYHTYSVPEEED